MSFLTNGEKLISFLIAAYWVYSIFINHKAEQDRSDIKTLVNMLYNAVERQQVKDEAVLEGLETTLHDIRHQIDKNTPH